MRVRVHVQWPRQCGKTRAAAALTRENEGREMTVINPPGPDWHDRLYRRLREALERARRDDCTRCRAEGAGFRHWAYPSECGAPPPPPPPPPGGVREPHKDEL